MSVDKQIPGDDLIYKAIKNPDFRRRGGNEENLIRENEILTLTSNLNWGDLRSLDEEERMRWRQELKTRLQKAKAERKRERDELKRQREAIRDSKKELDLYQQEMLEELEEEINELDEEKQELLKEKEEINKEINVASELSYFSTEPPF